MRLREVPPPCSTCMVPSSILSHMTPRFSSSRTTSGRVLGQHAHQFRLVLEMAAADGVEVMARRRIGARDGGLHAAFGHHGVGVAHAQLGGDQRLDAVARGRDGRPAARRRRRR